VHTLFEELIHRPWGGQEWKPCADIVETDAEYTIIMDLPGVDAENLKVVAGDGQVLIEGIRDIEHGAEQDDLILSERPSGGFARVFEFEAPVDTSDITTEQENGVVKIIVRKKK
jgi:HSP20 family protein